MRGVGDPQPKGHSRLQQYSQLSGLEQLSRKPTSPENFHEGLQESSSNSRNVF